MTTLYIPTLKSIYVPIPSLTRTHSGSKPVVASELGGRYKAELDEQIDLLGGMMHTAGVLVLDLSRSVFLPLGTQVGLMMWNSGEDESIEVLIRDWLSSSNRSKNPTTEVGLQGYQGYDGFNQNDGYRNIRYGRLFPHMQGTSSQIVSIPAGFLGSNDTHAGLVLRADNSEKLVRSGEGYNLSRGLFDVLIRASRLRG